LDGTSLHDAIRTIDETVFRKPDFYCVQCVHASLFDKSMEEALHSAPDIADRLIGFFANTSSLPAAQLDHSQEIQSDTPEKFAQDAINLTEQYHLKLIGGCCGSTEQHIERLAEQISQMPLKSPEKPSRP